MDCLEYRWDETKRLSRIAQVRPSVNCGALPPRSLEPPDLQVKMKNGGVGEWLNPAVLKTVRPERVSGVRIPPPPPFSHQLSFSVLTVP